MSTLEPFKSHQKFYAEKYFPHGISRSGEFTRDQAALLENYGSAYQALHSGTRILVNDEERHFLSVCQGEKTPKTDHENAWMRFCYKINEPF